MKKIIVEHIAPGGENNDIENFLNEVNDDFIPALSKRVNIYEYVDKIVKNAEVFNLRYGNEIIGNAAVYMNQGYGFISSFAIKKEYRGYGYSRCIFKEIMQVAKKNNLKKICLAVNTENARAINVYISLGFSEYSRCDDWIYMSLFI